MNSTLVIGAMVGVHTVVSGAVRLVLEHRAFQRGAPRFRIVEGAVSTALGVVLLVLTMLLATGQLH